MRRVLDNAEPVSIGEATVVAFTDRAILFRTDGFGELWVPRSVIDMDSDMDLSDVNKGDEGEIFIEAWWADKEL